MSRSRRGAAFVVAGVTFSIVASLLPAAGAQARTSPTLLTQTKWAWVTMRFDLPTPAVIDQGNSSGGTNTAAHSGYAGEMHIHFPGVGDAGGTVQISPIGASARNCVIDSWTQNGSDEDVYVYCASASGLTALNSKFTVAYLATIATTGRLAYLWAGNPTAPSYTPDTTFSYNSAGEANTIIRLGTGYYQVTLSGLASQRGDVQVSPYTNAGAATAAGDGTATNPQGAVLIPAICNVASWVPDGTAMIVQVQCRDPFSGNPYDSRFTLAFTQGLGLKGVGGTRVAYTFANQATAASYAPPAQYTYMSNGKVPLISRQGAGAYTVTLPGMPKGGTAIVTAYGRGKRHCIVGSIRIDATPQRVHIRCFDSSDNPVNARFTLSFER
jgi:hypothetical protein